MKALRVALVGAGAIAKAHMSDFYSRFPLEAEVVSVVDPISERLVEFTASFGNIDTYSSIEEVLSREDVDAVDICAPPHFHGELALKAAERGKHVLVEKPFALKYEDALRAVEAAEKNKTTLMVMQNYRWRPEYQQARSMIQQNMIGEPFLIQLTGNFDWSGFPMYRRKMEKMLLFEVTVHYLDLMRFLLGSEAKRVYAKIGSLERREEAGETHAALIVEFENDCIVHLLNSADCLGGKAKWGGECIIQGSEGSLSLNLTSEHSFSGYSHMMGGELQAGTLQSKPWFEEPIRHFVTSVQGATEPITGGRDNLKTLQIVYAAYLSSEKGLPVDV